MSHTLPSRKVLYKVFVEDENECILEVKRRDNFLIYEIASDGSSKLLTNGPIPYHSSDEESYNYLDLLPLESLAKIDILTVSFDYYEVIADLNLIIRQIEEKYSFRDFGMNHANIFEDYKDALKQLAEFTSEDEYSERHTRMTAFFDEFFFERTKELNSAEKDYIINQLKKEVIFLHSLNSN
jgi:hypothetical protein